MKYIKYETKLEINWIDSGYWFGWHDKEDIKRDIETDNFYEDCKSVGYYAGENKRLIFLCLSQSEVNGCDVMYIPKVAINNIRIIK